MPPRFCECGRALVMRSKKRWSRHGYRRIKGHDLCRKCNASLRDRMWSTWKNGQRPVVGNAAQPRQEEKSEAVQAM